MHRARRRHGGNASTRLSWEAPARWTDAPETQRYQAANPLPLRERWQPWSCGRANMRHTGRGRGLVKTHAELRTKWAPWVQFRNVASSHGEWAHCVPQRHKRSMVQRQ